MLSLSHRSCPIYVWVRPSQALGEVADAALPSMCYGLPLPCAAEVGAVRRASPQQCLQENDLHGLMEEADRYYCERYTGDVGGRNSTNMAIYPFMKQVRLIPCGKCADCLL